MPYYTVDQVMGLAQFKRWPSVTYRIPDVAFATYRIGDGLDAWNEWAQDARDEGEHAALECVVEALIAIGAPNSLEAAGFRLSPPQPRTPLPPLKPMRQVRYVDSAYKSDQSPDVIGVCHIVAVGFVIADEADHLTLAREDLTDGTWRDQLAIPKGAIVEMREVVPK